MKVSYWFEKILTLLRVRPATGALEISDTALRFAHFDGARWQLKAEHLPPGVFEQGELKDASSFQNLLQEFRAHIFPARKPTERIDIVVVLSSANVYSQVFSLPWIQGEGLANAVTLNLQMVSPGEVSETHAGWQVVGGEKNLGRVEILSAFLKKSIMDDIRRPLASAFFLPVSVEFKALALTRLLREEGSGFDALKSYLLVSVDDTGLDFLVIRHGELYFEYTNLWRDVQGSEREISETMFQTAVIRSLHQVLNFYSQHWPDQVTEILVAAGNLNEQVSRLIRENFSLAARELTFKTVSPESQNWLVVLGSGLRTLLPKKKDTEINFVKQQTEKEFSRARILHFLEFWRVTLPVSLGLFAAVLFAAHAFLGATLGSLESQILGVSAENEKSLQDFSQETAEFNSLVQAVRDIRASSRSITSLLEKAVSLAASEGVTLSRFEYKSPEAPARFVGEAKSEESIIKFKKALGEAGIFRDIELPLSDITHSANQPFSFSLSFRITFEKTE